MKSNSAYGIISTIALLAEHPINKHFGERLLLKSQRQQLIDFHQILRRYFLALLVGLFCLSAMPSLAATPMLAGGASQTCALAENGTVQCWGYNSTGRLGNGTTTDSTSPVAVTGITTAVQIAAGNDHSCAVLANGTVQCWGNNLSGELGNGTNSNSAEPVTVQGISQATWVATGRFHSCAALVSGTVQCWGRNYEGELGNGTIIDSNVPVTVKGISNAKTVVSDNYHSCALLRDGQIQCWGYGFFGQLGNGSNNVVTPTPVTVSGITNATAIAVGGNHSCALLSDQTLSCWGNGQLNIAQPSVGTNQNDTATPVAVNGLTSVIALSIGGGTYNCALISDGSLKCWGSIIGGGKVISFRLSTPTPTSIPGIANAAAVSVSLAGACALIDDGTVQCWGVNPLGDGTVNDSQTPVTVSGSNDQGTLNLGRNPNGNADKLFSWAEQNYGAYFAPAHQTSETLAGYYLRYYPDSQSLLAVNAGRLFYVGPLTNYQVFDLGLQADWFAKVK